MESKYDHHEFLHHKKPTNVDRIRAMSVEDLAAWFARVEWEAGLKMRPITEYAMRMEWLDWLQQESDNV